MVIPYMLTLVPPLNLTGQGMHFRIVINCFHCCNQVFAAFGVVKLLSSSSTTFFLVQYFVVIRHSFEATI